jgi:hypothetical protein
MYNDDKAKVIFGCGSLIFVLVISIIAGAFLWPYTINTWLVYFGKPEAIKMWHGALIGFIPFIGQATIPAAFITWIMMMFLV